MTCYQEITCPSCKSNQIGKSGRGATGEPRYRCRNPLCATKTFMLNYRYRACQAGIKEKVVEMAINGSGIRDTARVLKINNRTWIKRLNRKTICFSKLELLHDTVIGLLINKVEFGLDIHA